MKRIFYLALLAFFPFTGWAEHLQEEVTQDEFQRTLHWMQGLYDYHAQKYPEALQAFNAAVDLTNGDHKINLSIRVDRGYVHLAMHNNELALRDFDYVLHQKGLTSEHFIKANMGRIFICDLMSPHEREEYYEKKLQYLKEQLPPGFEMVETESGVVLQKR